jgi:hypothetical protein
MGQHKRPVTAKNSPVAKAHLWVRIYWAAIVAVLVAAIGLAVAFSRVGDNGSGLMWLEVGKLCAQFFILVVLGVLVSYTLDQLKTKNSDERAVEARREDYVRRLIDITHDVDLARLLIFANRSVTSWSEQMTGRIIPSYTAMRDLTHDLKTAQQAGRPVFIDWAKILLELLSMNEWLKKLCLEFAERRERLSPLKQDEEWEAMLTLPLLGDLVRDESLYGEFRETYTLVLASMRQELNSRSSNPQEPDFSPGDVMELHSLYMSVWEAVSDGNRTALGPLVAWKFPGGPDAALDALQDRQLAEAPLSTQIMSAYMENDKRAFLIRSVGQGGQRLEKWEFVRESTDRPWKLGSLEPINGHFHF